MIRLWTIQTEAAYRRLIEDGQLIAEPNLRDPDFVRSYEWMLDQMLHRLRPIERRPAAALWAWARWDPPKRNRPDLRARGHLPRGDAGYRIELDANRDDVLLSDYNLWHHVLNYFYVPSCERDGDRFDAEHDPHRYNWERLPPKPLHNLIAASWERIFDLKWWDDYVTGNPGERPVQATLWRIDLSMVRVAQRFVSR